MINKLMLVIALTITALSATAQPVTFDWARSMGGKNSTDGSMGITRDASGNIYVTGDFSGSRTFGSITLTTTAFSEVFVAKYNSNGTTCLWAIKGGSNFATAYGGKIAVQGNNVYATGYFTGLMDFGSGVTQVSTGSKDMFLISIDAVSGIPNWVRKGGGTFSDVGVNIIPCAAGGIIVCGNFTSTATFGTLTVTSSANNDPDIFIAKYTDAGVCSWVKRYGSTGTDDVMDIKELPSNELLITGGFQLTVAFGSTNLTSAGGTDYYLAKLDNSGNALWAVRGGGINTDIGNAVSFDPSGNIYTTGFIADTAVFGSIVVNNPNNINVIVIKHSPAGVFQWVRQGGAILDDIGFDIVADFAGSTYFTGQMNGSGNFGTTPVTGVLLIDAIAGKYDTAGTLRWITRISGPDNDYGKSILLDNNGYCIVAGDYSGSLIAGSSLLTSSGGSVGTFITRVGGGTVGLHETIEVPFSIYPNPSSDFIQLNLTKITDLVFTVEIISIDGKVVYQKQLTQADVISDYKIDISSVASGNFSLKLSTSKGDFSKAIVVSR